MVAACLKGFLCRLVLPAALLIGALCRPSFLSVIYVLFAFLGPLLPSVQASVRVPAANKAYILTVLSISLAASIAQLAYQIYENISTPNVDDYTLKCNSSDFEFWMRQTGLIRIKHNAGFDTVRVIFPEVLALVASLITAIVCLALPHQTHQAHRISPHVQPVRATSSTSRGAVEPSHFTDSLLAALKRSSDVSVILFVALVGIIQPSLLNAVYFIVFLVVATWYAVYAPIRRHIYNGIKLTIIFYAAVHFLVVFIYQIPYFAQILPGDSFAARLIGLVPILLTNCGNWWSLNIISSDRWTSVASPILVLVLYYVLIIQYEWTRYGIQRSFGATGSDSSSVHEENLAMSQYAVSHTVRPENGASQTVCDANATNMEDQFGNTLLANEEGLPHRESVPLQRVTSTSIDRQKIASIFIGPEGMGTMSSQGLITVLSSCLYHFYAFALLAMMLWALLYHSVFGLVFLLLACFFWVLSNTRSATYKASPIILAYAEFLLVEQYVFSMNLSGELPRSDVLRLIGFIIEESATSAFVVLFIKVLLCLPLFFLLRLHLREKFYNSLSDRDRLKRLTYGTFNASGQQLHASSAVREAPHFDESRSTRNIDRVQRILTKYWIFLVALVLLLISIVPEPVVLYNVFYFMFFGLLLTLLQISLVVFRTSLFTFWTVLIFYTSLVLVGVYCYQFPDVPKYWHDWTGLSNETNHDIGLINYKEEQANSEGLFEHLIAPIALFVLAMLQLKIFHGPWTKLVSPPRGAVVTSDALGAAEENVTRCEKARTLLRWLIETLWRLAEVHIAKIVMLVLIIVAVNDICALNLVIVGYISVAVCFPAFISVLSIFLCIYLSIFALARMIYQMHFVTEDIAQQITSVEDRCNISGYLLPPTTQWLGFRKVSYIGSEISGIVIALVALSAQVVIYYRQRHIRMLRGEAAPNRGVVFFRDADPKKWDASLIDMIKFFINYGFYKFGLEISLTMMVVVAWVRMDLLGSLLLIWLFAFCCVSRSVCRRLWPVLLIYLAIMFLLQYALYVGLPSALCVDYPWRNWLPTTQQNENLVSWLDLASYPTNLHPNNSIADFFLLIMVACQEYVFLAETSTTPPPAAGDNNSIYSKGEYKLRNDNPHHDFVAEQRNFVDFLKVAVFMYGHWATLVMVLVAGLGGVSLFALGYIILAFWMLWQGNNLYSMKNYHRTLKRWNTVVLYTVFVMFWKVTLQIVGCAFIHLLEEKNLCFLRQLFSIVCVNTAAKNYFSEQEKFEKECAVERSETQIGFDTFAFGFLVMQMRILHSFYFQHCMLDFRAEAVLTNRGAVLTNQLIEKEMKEQNEQQGRKFKEIKERTAKIRKRYEQLQQMGGASAFTPETYGQAKRAGDYYMFGYDPSADELVEPVETFVPEVTPGASDFDKLDPAQLLHTAVQRDLDLAGTLNAVEAAERIKDEEKRMIEAVSAGDTGLEADTPEEHQETSDEHPDTGPKTNAVFRFLQKLILSALDWTAAFLNRRSRDHRYVAYVLTKEKEKLKRNLKEPLCDVSLPLVGVREEFERCNLQCVTSESDIEQLEQEALDNWQQRNVFARLITAVGHCIAAHTDILCYVFAVIDHARCAGVLSLPLPLLVFFWGTLASPRPSKSFWVVMIGYTQLVVVIKFIGQFGFFPWNETSHLIKTGDSISTQGIIGVRKEEFYALWDIILLVALFFHRYMLRKMGLWKDANVSDTFTGDTTLDEASARGSEVDISQSNVEAQIDSRAAEGPNGGSPGPAEESQIQSRGRISSFFHQLFHPKFRYIRDLYPFMFLLDVLCFFIISFGYSSFDYSGSGSVVKDITTNRVPITFVVMLIVLSLMIVVDRALYLRKAVFCKLLYQFAIVIFIHVWIFFVLPLITSIPAWLNSTAQFLYFIKCIYLLISAWQIRNKYPTLCIGNLITHAYGLANMIFFKIFMAVPFLFELRTAMDWTWTDTSMPLFDFFNMENFYATIYNLKCARTFEQNFPAPRGVAKGVVVKYLMGLPLILILILIIWLPLLAFSLLNRIGNSLPPNSAQMTISVEGYPPLFVVEARGIELEMFNNSGYEELKRMFSDNDVYNLSDRNSVSRARQALAFIGEYTPSDIMKVRFRPQSEEFWSISNDALDAMKFELEHDSKDINAIVKLVFERVRGDESKEPMVHSCTARFSLKKKSKERDNLIALINGNKSAELNMTLTDVLQPYALIPNEGEIKAPVALVTAMQGLLPNISNRLDQTAWDLAMKLKAADNMTDMLWTAEMVPDEANAKLAFQLEEVPYGKKGLRYVQIVAFVDRVFPNFITKYVQGGIIAMYVAVVLLVGRLIRGMITNAPLDVIISEIPNPDYLLKICLDIYLVREAKDFVLEQDLFAKLIFLFRSPATLIKWTRYKVKTD